MVFCFNVQVVVLCVLVTLNLIVILHAHSYHIYIYMNTSRTPHLALHNGNNHIALFLCFRADPPRSSLHEWLALHSVFCLIHRSGAFTALFGCYMAGATWNCCCLGARSAYTIQPCTSSQCRFIQSHIRRVRVCLAATCTFTCFGVNTGVERIPK